LDDQRRRDRDDDQEDDEGEGAHGHAVLTEPSPEELQRRPCLNPAYFRFGRRLACEIDRPCQLLRPSELLAAVLPDGAAYLIHSWLIAGSPLPKSGFAPTFASRKVTPLSLLPALLVCCRQVKRSFQESSARMRASDFLIRRETCI